MHTLKEILAEPQTMYDGGLVRMQDGGQPPIPKKRPVQPPIPKKKPVVNRLDKRLQNISEATGSDKLRGSEVREYIEGIRRGEINDPDFLRTYESTQKGLEHYTEEEIKSMGMEDPWLSPAIKRTTPESRKVRQLLTKVRGTVPLVELGLDPTRLVASSMKTNTAGTYSPVKIDSGWYEEGVMEEMINLSDRPELFDEGDYIQVESGIKPIVPINIVLFHEAAHRGIQILEKSANFKLPRLTKDLKAATDTTSEEDLISEHLNNEIWVRLLEHKYYTPGTSKEKQEQTKRNNEFLSFFTKKGSINKPYNRFTHKINRLIKQENIKSTLDYIRYSSRKELEKRGFPKIKDESKPSIFQQVPSRNIKQKWTTRPTNMYDGGVVRMVDGGDTREEALKLRQKAEQIEVPEEEIFKTPVATQTTLPVPKSVEKSLPKIIEKVSKGFLRKSPVIQIAYSLYNTLPKRFGQLPDILEYLKDTQTHELFGLDKSGQEYLQETLNKIFSKKISVEDINELDFYHGTTATDLEGGALRASTEGSLDRGLYITPDPKYAASRGIKGEALGGNIHPVKVNIKNPLIIRFNKTDSSIQGKLLEVLDITQGKENPVDTAISKGYDSIFIVDEETNEIIEASIFDENNVSSKFKDPSPVADATIPGFMTKIIEEKRNKAFEDLAWEQRGNPEAAMLELQEAIGGGVLGNLAEHVGDLTHRMSEKFDYLKGSPTSVASKIKSTLRTLRSDYGFEKEYLENIKNNAEFHNIPVEELLNKGNEKLAEYANEHRKLKVYNEPQKWARDAAVAIGEKNWNKAITELEKLEDLIKNPDAYDEAVSKFDEDFDASPVADATIPGFEYPKKVFHSTTAGRWPEGSEDIPQINPEFGGSDIGFHVMEKEDLSQYYRMKKGIDNIYTIPLKGNIDKTIKIPDMGRFRNPINWIREMSTSQISHLSNKELEEYSIRIPSDIARYISEVRPPDNMYPKKSTIEMLGDNRGEALKLWKDIIQGALKHQSEFESGKVETSEKWIKFLQNVLDKQGADAFSYENYKEGTGELSYMILDSPETIGKKIKGAFVEKPDPTKPELSKYKGGQVIPMYDGGVVGMANGGPPEDQKKFLEARQKIEQIEVPEEPTPTGTAVVEGAKKLAKGVVKQAVRRIPGVGLIDPSPAGAGSTIFTPDEFMKKLSIRDTKKLESFRDQWPWKDSFSKAKSSNNQITLPDRLQEKIPMVIDNIISEITKDNPDTSALASRIIQQLDADGISKDWVDSIIHNITMTPPDKIVGLKKSGNKYVGDLWNQFYDDFFSDIRYENNVRTKWREYSAVPQEKLPVIPKSNYTKKFGKPSSLIKKDTIPKLLEKYPNILLDSDGDPVLVFRGSRLWGDRVEDRHIAQDILKGKSQENYATFLSDNPYVSSTFGDTLIPFFIRANKVIEFPVKAPFDKGGSNRFDMFEFDRVSKTLKKGEVLVVKNVVDTGPLASSGMDPLKKWAYGHNQYAIRDEGQLINAIVEKNKGGQVITMYDGGMVQASAKPMYDGGLV